MRAVPDAGVVIAVAGVIAAFCALAGWYGLRRAARAEDRYNLLAEQIDQWVWETNADHRLVHLSNYRRPSAGSLIGTTRAEMLDPTFRPAEMQQHLAELAAHRAFHNFVFRRVLADGSHRYIRVTGEPRFDGAGRFQGYSGVGADVTREVMAEDAKKIAESRLLAAIEALSIGFALFGPDGRLLLRNRGFARFNALQDNARLGATFEDLLRDAVASRQIADAFTNPDAWIADRLEAHREGRGAYMVQLADGRLLRSADRRLADGSVVVTQIDLTDQHQREATLAEERRRLRDTLEAVDDGFVMVDRDFRILVWNSRFAALCGHRTGALSPGLMLRDLVIGANERGADAQLLANLSGPSDGGPLVLESTRAEDLVLQARRQPLIDGGWVIIIRDITSQRRFELALQQAKEQAELANRAKTNFLANMSHELRTPLNAIIGFSEIVKDELLGPIGTPRYIDYLRDIHMSGAHLLEVINDILDLSKIESGQLELRERPVDVGRAMGSTVRLLRDRAEAAGVVLTVTVADDLPALLVDERALRQILLNLLSNAVKFTPAGGTVAVRAEVADDGDFLLSVTDTGIGMAVRDIPKALAPFGQVDSSLTRRYEGTGLGLPLVKSLAEMHGGSVEIDSEPGRGTMVSIRLPAARLVSEVHAARLALAAQGIAE
jgi:PAS domain S-box-containing protein